MSSWEAHHLPGLMASYGRIKTPRNLTLMVLGPGSTGCLQL